MVPKIPKVDNALQKLLSEKRIKSIEDKRVGSEVFDKKTLETLYKLANMKKIHTLNGAISTGKEANVFRGTDDEDNFIAVKIYRVATSDFKKMQYYIQGDPRFHLRSTNKRQIVHAWVNKEYRNLKRAHDAGVRVPKPIVAKNNVLIMEFIGDENGNPAPTMKQSPPSNPKDVLDEIIHYMKLLHKKARLVHGDLSSFNILIQEEEPVIIDLSQGVVIDHPISDELLRRDVKNIARDFKKLGVLIPEDEIISRIMDP